LLKQITEELKMKFLKEDKISSLKKNKMKITIYNLIIKKYNLLQNNLKKKKVK
jgi:hypothetical protein